MLSFLQKFNNTRAMVILGVLVVILLGALAVYRFNDFAQKEAFESGLPKRTVVDYLTQESENLFSKLVSGKPSETVNKREEARKANLKRLGKTTDLSKEGKDLKEKVLSKPISINRGDYLIKKESSYQVTYIEFPDLFFVNVTGEPVEKYQKEAETWFLSQGFNQKDLCGLGINFVIDRNLRLKVGYPLNDHLPYCT